MGQPLPLPTLLSQILVAFTIEFDNEAEHRLPHRTTVHGISGDRTVPSPWLTSMVMWFNCMQHLGQGPIPLRALEQRSRTETNLHGMQRWGYIRLASDQDDLLDRRPKSARTGSIVHPTIGGRAVREVWATLFTQIEERWSDRFGSIEISALRDAARAIARQLDPHLPDCMPILGYGLTNARSQKSAPPSKVRNPVADAPSIDNLHLPSLISKILLAFALEFESESPLSLAICADVIRVLNSEGVQVRHLPALSGVSKEAIAMAFGILRKAKHIVVGKESAKSPWQVARLTEAGVAIQQSYPARLASIEKRWQSQFGASDLRALRDAAETIVGDAPNPDSPLMQGITPYRDGWRATVPKPRTLPHFPMVLHRGGYPDGS